MIALDTNVLVRYVVADDPEQAQRAAAFIEGAAERGERLYVPHIVLCELVWVLARAYRRKRTEIASVITGLLRASQVVVEEPDIPERALERYLNGSADFADYLIAERSRAAGCTQVATFDEELLKDGAFVRP